MKIIAEEDLTPAFPLIAHLWSSTARTADIPDLIVQKKLRVTLGAAVLQSETINARIGGFVLRTYELDPEDVLVLGSVTARGACLIYSIIRVASHGFTEDGSLVCCDTGTPLLQRIGTPAKSNEYHGFFGEGLFVRVRTLKNKIHIHFDLETAVKYPLVWC